VKHSRSAEQHGVEELRRAGDSGEPFQSPDRE
jgi:hypothetical protein